MNLFARFNPEIRRILDDIPALIDKTFPLPGRFRAALPADVAELSRLLTGGRGERSLSYLNRPSLLSAYLRYFLPWNLYRLCRLLPALSIPLAANDVVTDLGSGPLTFCAALWISRPDLRHIPLEFRCVDLSGPALEAGKKFFSAFAGDNSPWKIRTVRGDIGAGTVSGRHGTALKGKPAALVCAINVLNELYIPHGNSDGFGHSAEVTARLLDGFSAASILVVEPGVPRSGQFISLLREALIKRGRPPVSPCLHEGACPFPGGVSGTGKNRWCHFAFETEDAPQPLRRLSAAAGIPKERAVLSFLLAGPAAFPVSTPPQSTAQSSGGETLVRVISDAFPLPDKRFGRYGCSERGLVLVAGEKKSLEDMPSGALIKAAFTGDKGRDPKSGAFMAVVS
jgi:ribosomal protein RSM22 (predicted rRNA methylase)